MMVSVGLHGVNNSPPWFPDRGEHRPHARMPVSEADEIALLREALEFIGDLDFDTDAAADEDEDDVLSRLLQDDEPDIPTSPLAVSITETALPIVAMVAETSTSTSSTSALHTQPVGHHDSPVPTVPQPSATTQRWLNTFGAKPATGNLSRSRRREEIAYLRDLVGDLEKRLTSLRPSPSEVVTVSPTAGSNELVGAWADVATRQYKQRQRSEMENINLKRLLQDQIQLGRSFERLLMKKRPTMELLEQSNAVSKRLRPTNSWSSRSGFEFEELLARCARQYAETAKILAKFTDDKTGINHRDVGLIHDPEFGLTIQTKECRILPFNYEDTVSEVWGFHPSDTPDHSIEDFDDVDETEDTLKLRMRVLANMKRTCGKFAVTIVMRRFVESTRTVMVLSGIAQPSELAAAKIEGVRIRFSAWIILEPVESRVATKLTTFDLSVPEVDDSQSHHVGMLTDFLLSTMAIETEYRNQQWENRLFQRAFNCSQ